MKDRTRGRTPFDMRRNTETLVRDIVDLPTLPQVVTTLLAMLDDPKSSVRDINSVMGKDQALVAKLLKLVNSAFYAIPTRVSSIPQAIAILGFKTIKSMVISASVIGLFESDNEDFSYQEFWANSLGVATVSRFIVLRLASDPQSGCVSVLPDDAFVSGLLSGIGKVVLDQYDHDDFTKIIVTAKEEKLSFKEAEARMIDGSYATIGHWLAKRWNLPDGVQTPIKHQDDLENCPREHRAATAVLTLAKYLCRVRQYGQSGDYDHPVPPRAAAICLNLNRETLPALAAGMAEEFAKTESFLSMIRS